MKQFIKEFFKRGLAAAGGGPIVLAIIYGIHGKVGAVSALSPQEVCLGILTVTLLALIAGGMTAIYQMEQLPLLVAVLIHGAALYADYLIIYLINGWLLNQLVPIAVFTGIFIVGYAVIWLFIYTFTKAKTKKLNALLHTEQ